MKIRLLLQQPKGQRATGFKAGNGSQPCPDIGLVLPASPSRPNLNARHALSPDKYGDQHCEGRQSACLVWPLGLAEHMGSYFPLLPSASRNDVSMPTQRFHDPSYNTARETVKSNEIATTKQLPNTITMASTMMKAKTKTKIKTKTKELIPSRAMFKMMVKTLAEQAEQRQRERVSQQPRKPAALIPKPLEPKRRHRRLVGLAATCRTQTNFVSSPLPGHCIGNRRQLKGGESSRDQPLESEGSGNVSRSRKKRERHGLAVGGVGVKLVAKTKKPALVADCLSANPQTKAEANFDVPIIPEKGADNDILDCMMADEREECQEDKDPDIDRDTEAGKQAADEGEETSSQSPLPHLKTSSDNRTTLPKLPTLQDGNENVSADALEGKPYGQVMRTLRPSNLEEQELAFFSAECSSNPQFTYDNPRLASKMLRLFQKPKGNLLSLAVRIMEGFLTSYGSESRFLADYGGELLSLDETKTTFTKYIGDLGLAERIKLHFTHNTVSPTSIVHDPRSGLSTVIIGLPVEYRRNRILGVLNHEIGTHFIRKYNDQLQPWAGCRSKHQLHNYIATEEGLASLNQLFDILSSTLHRL